MKEQFSPQLLAEISEWLKKGISSWAHADTLSMWILPAFIERDIATEKDFIPWLSSPFSFQRRCVSVTFIRSLKKVSSPEPLFLIIEPLMADAFREIQQGQVGF